MSGTRWFDPGFVNPFTRKHCVVIALTALQAKGNRTAEFARGLAVLAQRTRSKRKSECDYLLTPDGSSWATEWRIAEWAQIAGLKVVETYRPVYHFVEGSRELPGYHTWDDDGNRIPVRITITKRVGRPTVAQFLRTKGRRGSWFILTDSHAQASRNGRALGSVSKRDRVHFAVKVEA